MATTLLFQTKYNNIITSVVPSSPAISYDRITYYPANDCFYLLDNTSLYRIKNSNNRVLVNNSVPAGGKLRVAMDGTLYIFYYSTSPTTYNVLVSTNGGTTFTTKSLPGVGGPFNYFKLCPVTNKIFGFIPSDTNINSITFYSSSDRGSTWNSFYTESSGNYAWNSLYYGVSNYVIKDKGFFIRMPSSNVTSNFLMFVQSNPSITTGSISSWGTVQGGGKFFLKYNDINGYELVDVASTSGYYWNQEVYDENNNMLGYNGARLDGRYRIWQA